jgi:hypothetical protein
MGVVEPPENLDFIARRDLDRDQPGVRRIAEKEPITVELARDRTVTVNRGTRPPGLRHGFCITL